MTRYPLSLSLVCAALLVLAPDAQAQEDQQNAACIINREIAIVVPNDPSIQFLIEIWTLDDYLEAQDPGGASTFPFYTYTTPRSDPDGPGGNPPNPCVWTAETNFAQAEPDPLPSTGNPAFLPPNTPYVIDILPLRAGAPQRTFTYALCASDGLDPSNYPAYDPLRIGFYCPYGGATNDQDNIPDSDHTDMNIVWDGVELDLRPFGYGLPVGMSVGEVLAERFGPAAEEEWVLPYDRDALCDAYSANPAYADCLHDEVTYKVFISPQVGYDYTFAPVDLNLTETFTWTWTEAAAETVRLQPGTKLLVEGDLTAEGVTFTAEDAPWGWGGIEVASDGAFSIGGTTDVTAPITVQSGAQMTVAPDVTLDLGGDLTVKAGGALDVLLDNQLPNDLRFGPGARLVVEGTADMGWARLTERDPGQGWGGLQVVGGSLATDDVTVEQAATGVAVYRRQTPHGFTAGTATLENSTLRLNSIGLGVFSDGGTVLRNVTVEHNGTGIRTDSPQSPGGPAFCRGGCGRSDLDVFDSFVRYNAGIGVSAFFADVEIRDTEIAENTNYGVLASSATVDPFTGNRVVGNGVGDYKPGALAMAGGNLLLSPQNARGENRIASNSGSEVVVDGGGLAFLGDGTGDSGFNSVFDPAPALYSRLVRNNSKTLVDANFVYWGQPGGPPPGTLAGPVDATLPLTCDPVFPPAPDDPSPCTANRGDGPVAAGRSQALAQAIQATRAALAAALGGPEAEGLVYALGGLHRLDADDASGEWAATAALLASVRGALAAPELPAAEQASAEAALEVEVLHGLTHGEVAATAGLLQTWRARVASGEVLRVLSLVEASLNARVGRYGEAAAVASAVAAGDVEAEVRQGVEALAAYYAARAAETGDGARGAAPVVADLFGAKTGASAAAEAEVSVWPNPVRRQATVALTLGMASEATVVVYDVLGREVAVLHEGPLAAGSHRFRLEAARLPGGVYLVRAEAGQARLTARVTVVR